MSKENYEKTELEIIKFQTKDVITTSSTSGYDESRYETPRLS